LAEGDFLKDEKGPLTEQVPCASNVVPEQLFDTMLKSALFAPVTVTAPAAKVRKLTSLSAPFVIVSVSVAD